MKKLLYSFSLLLFISFTTIMVGTFPQTGAYKLTVQELQNNEIFINHLGDGVVSDDSLAQALGGGNGELNWSHSSNNADGTYVQNGGAIHDLYLLSYDTLYQFGKTNIQEGSKSEITAPFSLSSRPLLYGNTYGVTGASNYITTQKTAQGNATFGQVLGITGFTTAYNGSNAAIVEFIDVTGGNTPSQNLSQTLSIGNSAGAQLIDSLFGVFYSDNDGDGVFWSQGENPTTGDMSIAIQGSTKYVFNTAGAANPDDVVRLSDLSGLGSDGVINNFTVTGATTKTATITTTNGGTPITETWIDEVGCDTDCSPTNELTNITLDDGAPTIAGKEGDRYFDNDYSGTEWIHDGTQWNERTGNGGASSGVTSVPLTSSVFASPSVVNLHWTRVGDYVTFWGSFTAITSAAGGTTGFVQLGFPIATEITSKHDVAAQATIVRDAFGFNPLTVRKVEGEVNTGVPDRIELQASGFANSLSYDVVINGSYEVK